MRQIFLLGAYGQRNLGDDALLAVCRDQFPGDRIVVNSAAPAATARDYGVTAIPSYGGGALPASLRALAASDLIVFGGGSLLKEIEGGTVARVLYFLRILIILLLGALLRRPTVMVGVGVGPLTRPLYRGLARLAANLTTRIYVRDTMSGNLMRELGVRRPVEVTADIVFLPRPAPSAPEVAAHLPAGPFAAVVPRYSLTEAEVAALAAACDHLVTQQGLEILLLPFQAGYLPKYDDTSAAEAIRARMQHPAAAHIWAPATPGTALAALGAARLVVSARLHGLIFAAIQGVPAVAISYDDKVRSFMTDLGQAGACLDLDELRAGRLPARLDQVWAQRAAIAAAVRAKVAILREDAARNFAWQSARPAPAQRSGLLSGGALLFVSATVVNAGNYLFNLILGRWLGPAAFADLSLIITLMLSLTLVTTTFQTVATKFAAAQTARGDGARLAALRGWLGRLAWGGGLAIGGALALTAPLLQSFFQSQSPWPFVLLGLGIPFYLMQGVDRGLLQGATRFGRLALSYQAEMWVRLLAGIGLVTLGWAVNGATLGLVCSFVATWLVARTVRAGLAAPPPPALGERRAVVAFALPVLAALIGQVIINNSDVLIVKHFFSAAEAGQYAALALIGRIVFFATWSVVTVMFPLVAQRHEKGEAHGHLLFAGLGLVAGISGLIITACLLVPDFIVQVLFGPAYINIAPLLGLYALATALYALGNVVIQYRLSAGNGGSSLLALLAGGAQVVGLWLFHTSLTQVVLIQLGIMAGLLVVLLLWNVRLPFAGRSARAARSLR